MKRRNFIRSLLAAGSGWGVIAKGSVYNVSVLVRDSRRASCRRSFAFRAEWRENAGPPTTFGNPRYDSLVQTVASISARCTRMLSKSFSTFILFSLLGFGSDEKVAPSQPSIATAPVSAQPAGGPNSLPTIRVIFYIGDSIMAGQGSSDVPVGCAVPPSYSVPGAVLWRRWLTNSFGCARNQPRRRWGALPYHVNKTDFGPDGPSPVAAATEAYMRNSFIEQVFVVCLAKRGTDVPIGIWESPCGTVGCFSGHTWSVSRQSDECWTRPCTPPCSGSPCDTPGPGKSDGMWTLFRNRYLRPALESLSRISRSRNVEVAGVVFSFGNNMAKSCSIVTDTYVAEVNQLLGSIRKEILHYAQNSPSSTLSAVGVQLHLDPSCTPCDWDFSSQARMEQAAWKDQPSFGQPQIARALVDMDFLRTASSNCSTAAATPCPCADGTPGPSSLGSLISTDEIHPFWEGYDQLGDRLGAELALLNGMFMPIVLD